MSLTDKIKTLRKRSGLTMKEAAKRGGWASASSYQRYEEPTRFTQQWLPMNAAQSMIKAFVGRGSPQITRDEILALTQPLDASYPLGADTSTKVEVVVVAQAGVWKEAVELPQEERYYFPMPNLPGFEGIQVFGLIVRGSSMDQLYPEGCTAFFVSPEDYPPKEGHVVVIVRKRADLFETTLKELGRDKRNRLAYLPRSRDTRHQTVLYPSDSLEVIGVVIGKFEPMAAPPSRSRT